MNADADVRAAAEALRGGGLVAFPTETVYGLGADARNAAAVRKIYAAKGRPPTNPLIVHVASEEVARRYAAQWPRAAARLAARFWPGPLTLVVPRRITGADRVVDEVAAGRASVALRVPDHPLALELLRAFDGPVAAPSANRSTRVSPTTARHVRDELGDAIDRIVDGGPCRVGIESTVLDLTDAAAPPVILRPGGVSRSQIEAEVGPVGAFAGAVDPATAAASPGQHAVHYAPRAPAYRFEAADRPAMEALCRRRAGEPEAFLFLSRGEPVALPGDAAAGGCVVMPADPVEYARILYGVLRELDGRRVREIRVEMPPDAPEWAAVRDRLTRATRVEG